MLGPRFGCLMAHFRLKLTAVWRMKDGLTPSRVADSDPPGSTVKAICATTRGARPTRPVSEWSPAGGCR